MIASNSTYPDGPKEDGWKEIPNIANKGETYRPDPSRLPQDKILFVTYDFRNFPWIMFAGEVPTHATYSPLWWKVADVEIMKSFGTVNDDALAKMRKHRKAQPFILHSEEVSE